MSIFGAKSRAARGCASKLAYGRRIDPAIGNYEYINPPAAWYECAEGLCVFDGAPCAGGVEPIPYGVPGDFTFFRYVAENLPLPNGRTEASAPTERFTVLPMVRAILQLHPAGESAASIPTEILRGRRSLCKIVFASCAGGVLPRPYAKLSILLRHV